MNRLAPSGGMQHGERSASEADAKKDRESVGQTPGNTPCSPFLASANESEGGRWGGNESTRRNTGIGTDGVDRSRAERGPGSPSVLPCHTSEQLNPPSLNQTQSRGGKSQRLARLRVELETQGMCARWGVERIGFLTFTFADDVQTITEAQKRFNSLNSNALAGRYPEWIGVVQRHQDNRIHFHLVVVMPEDIRTGFDFDAVRRRDYSSACACLKNEWKFLRGALPEYQFGRHELLPVKNPQGFGTYVARYVGKTFQTRNEEKGARLVRFSKGFRRSICGPFSKVDLIEKRARDRLPKIIESLGWRSQAAMEYEVGPSWRYHLARFMYCDQFTFSTITTAVERSLEFYGGPMFVLAEEFKKARCAAGSGRNRRADAPDAPLMAVSYFDAFFCQI